MKKAFAASLGVLLVMGAMAMAGTYNGVQSIDVATDELNATTYIGSTGTDTVVTVTSDGSLFNMSNTNGIQIGVAAGGAATLIVDGGLVGNLDITGRDTINVGVNEAGLLDIRNSGTVYGNTGYFGRNVGSSAIINLSSGLLDMGIGAGYTHLAYAANTTAVLNQSGGTSNFATNTYLGNGAGSSGTVSISGGTANFLKQVYIGDADSFGRFEVIGSGATINANSTMSTTNRWYMYAGQSTLAFVLDNSDDHISCIDAYYTNIGGGTIDLSLSGGFTPTSGQTFDLLKDWDGAIVITNLTLASGDEYIDGVQSGWALQRNAAGDTLQAVYTAVPEPATMGLLGLGLVGLVTRRRHGKK